MGAAAAFFLDFEPEASAKALAAPRGIEGFDPDLGRGLVDLVLVVTLLALLLAAAVVLVVPTALLAVVVLRPVALFWGAPVAALACEVLFFRTIRGLMGRPDRFVGDDAEG